MTYSLEKFVELVSELLAFNVQDAEVSTDAIKKVYGLLQETTVEAEHLRSSLLKKILGIRKKKELGLFIQNFQVACITIADKIYKHTYTVQHLPINEDEVKELLHYLHAVMDTIDELLGFIELHFAKYFDKTQKLPSYYYTRWRQKIFLALSELKPVLYKCFDDAILINIAVGPLEYFIQPIEENKFCYADLIYLKNLLSVLKQHTQKKSITGFYTPLEECLFIMDFNNDTFVFYFMQQLRKKIGEQNNNAARITEWMMYEKAMHQIAAQSCCRLVSEKESLAVMLGKHISDEIVLLQNETVVQSSVSLNQNTEQNKILHFTLPVSQIAILLRLLVDGGFIKAHNQTDFLKRVAMIIQTDYAAVISAESLRNKYYAPERNNLSTVKDILFNLIKQMKRLE